MKKIFYMIFLSIFMSTIVNAQVKDTVTFTADFTDLIAQGFDSATDTVEIAGLNWDNGDDVTIEGDRFFTVDPNNSNMYHTQLIITTTANLKVGDSLRWKFHGYPDKSFDKAWEDGVAGYDGRAFVLRNDSTFTVGPFTPGLTVYKAGITNVVIFKADLTDIFGTGDGVFDPATDSLELQGFWADEGKGWIGAKVIDGSMGPLKRNFEAGVIFETTVTLQIPAGNDSGATTGYKFHAFPAERWADAGWEIGGNVAYVFQNDGDTVIVKRKPNILPKGGPIGKDVNVLFQCFMPENAINRYDSSSIPRDQIDFIILKGDNPAIGAWEGDWVAADTVDKGAIALYDNGKNGDKEAGDFIFSRTVMFPDSTPSGGVIYKFGAQYPAAGTVSQSSPLDNSKGVGQNFTFILQGVDTTVVLYEVWPAVDSGVDVEEIELISNKFELDQNYPNPFNPNTQIRFTIPSNNVVTLKVYNILGQEVRTLVNKELQAGSYKYDFRASELASGIYLYTLTSGNFVQTKKMMLLK